MHKLILICSLFFSFFFSSVVYSSDFFVLKNSNLSESQKVAVLEFLNKASDLIPMVIKESIKRSVLVSFEEIKSKDNRTDEVSSLPVDKCNNPKNIIYGKSNKLFNKEVVINQLLLEEIVKGEDKSISFNCGHKNFYRLAMATLLHEVSHLYDHANLGTTKVSGTKSFFRLSDWKRNLLLIGSSKNLSQKRTPDAYEYKSLDEHYAVNFEYFILDPEYKCKRPSYYLFYQKEFKVSPFENIPCKVNTQVRLDDTKSLIDISPERVYRVDYLLASKGDEMISGFGHSMYRLIVCAPFRKIVNADCLKDKLYHVVLSFRANVTDIKSNPIKGLIGKYDSMLFMLSFPKVVEEYNMSELRDLYSLPLNLTNEQKERFIHKALETYWEYAGSYKFLTANCASESTELLQAAINDHPIIKESVVKPYTLMEKLIEYKISNDNVFNNIEDAKKNGLFFESDSAFLGLVKSQLFGDEESDYKITKLHFYNKTGGLVNTIVQRKKKDVKEIIETISPERFKDLLEIISNEGTTVKAKKRLNDLSILAQSVLIVKQHNLDEEIGSFLEKVENEDSSIGQSIRNWNLKRKNFRLSPLKEDYGIPLEITDLDFETYKKENELLEKTEMDLVDNVSERYADKVEELKEFKHIIEEARTKSKIIGTSLYLGR